MWLAIVMGKVKLAKSILLRVIKFEIIKAEQKTKNYF